MCDCVLVFALLCLCAYDCVFVCVFLCLCVCACFFVSVPLCACDRKVAQETYDGWKGEDVVGIHYKLHASEQPKQLDQEGFFKQLCSKDVPFSL